MRLYTVQERAAAAGADPDVVLIKEGFCWPALVIPVLWLLYRWQWLGLGAYLVASGLLSGLVYLVGLDKLSAGLLSLLFSLLVAALANDWRRWRLSARGYDVVGVVAGGNLDRAEENYFRQRLMPAEAEEQAAAEAGRGDPLPASRLTPFATPFDPV